MRTLLIICFATLLNACVLTPTNLYNSESRRSVSVNDVDGLVVGRTTRQQVLLRFGTPDGRAGDESQFSYHWSKKKFYSLGILGAGGHGGGISLEYDKDYALRLNFDDDGVLTSSKLTNKGDMGLYSF